ncbi:unnamed protein product [Prunus armeniaca]|uniref:Uncharacterized protein n=1 Tax=Prunus armeniaca TaxID=36596 RepID=A0A6J5W033_PRUAR|nr:unnamed protein product [Prunus armeniaca]
MTCNADEKGCVDKVALQLESGVVSTSLQEDIKEPAEDVKGSSKIENTQFLMVLARAIVVFAGPHCSSTAASMNIQKDRRRSAKRSPLIAVHTITNSMSRIASPS